MIIMIIQKMMYTSMNETDVCWSMPPAMSPVLYNIIKHERQQSIDGMDEEKQ
jgi:hypothetical protein